MEKLLLVFALVFLLLAQVAVSLYCFMYMKLLLLFRVFVVSVVQLSLILRSFGDELSLFLNQSGSLGQTLATMPGGFGEVFEWRSPSESCLFEGLDVGF